MTITTQILIRKAIRTVVMTENTPTTHFAAHLISKGYTGQTFIGEAMPDGRKLAGLCGLFVRRAADGQFVAI